ncbi:MAG TPA: hypothetical protein PK054_10880 [Anaerohalosphaeraceae bacterium]|nr:hypothetical protein [Anaerohalosphaeraceae bacterium]
MAAFLDFGAEEGFLDTSFFPDFGFVFFATLSNSHFSLAAKFRHLTKT